MLSRAAQNCKTELVNNYTLKVNEQFYTYTFMTLIANLGGYIGLFTGASIFSVLEGGITMMLRFDKWKAMLTS